MSAPFNVRHSARRLAFLLVVPFALACTAEGAPESAPAIAEAEAELLPPVPGAAIHACVGHFGGLRLVDPAARCLRHEVRITWGSGGAQGPQGLTGAVGPEGAQGPQGADGAQGPEGRPGAEGAQGPEGRPGADGAQGPEGRPGADGAPGPAGPEGAEGRPGTDGAQGPQGEPGADGAQGPKGDPGPAGPAGPAGAAGVGEGGGLGRDRIYQRIGMTNGFQATTCDSPDDVLIDCECEVGFQYHDFDPASVPVATPINVVLNPVARRQGPGSESPDACYCTRRAPAGTPPNYMLAAVATCASPEPLCDGASAPNTGEICTTTCGVGEVGCDGTCGASNGPANFGEACVYADCACGDIPGTIGCNGTCEPSGFASRCCTFCGAVCSPISF